MINQISQIASLFQVTVFVLKQNIFDINKGLYKIKLGI